MRRYREDGERIIKLQSGIYVRRPQATPVRFSWMQELAEILCGFIVLGLLCASLWLWLAIGAVVVP